MECYILDSVINAKTKPDMNSILFPRTIAVLLIGPIECTNVVISVVVNFRKIKMLHSILYDPVVTSFGHLISVYIK